MINQSLAFSVSLMFICASSNFCWSQSESGNSNSPSVQRGVSTFVRDVGIYLRAMRVRNGLLDERTQTQAVISRLNRTVATNLDDEAVRVLDTRAERRRISDLTRSYREANNRVTTFGRRFSPQDIALASRLIEFIDDEIVQGAYTRQAQRRRARAIATRLREERERAQQRIDRVLSPITTVADVAVAVTAFTRGGFRYAVTAATGSGVLRRLNEEIPLNVRAENIWTEIVNTFNGSHNRRRRPQAESTWVPPRSYNPGPGPFDSPGRKSGNDWLINAKEVSKMMSTIDLQGRIISIH